MAAARRSAALLALVTLVGCGTSDVVRTQDAPLPVGPYSQAVRAGDTVYLSGQVGIDPASGALVPGGTAAEAARALANLDAVLRAAGLGRDDVVRAEVYLVDMADYAALNEAYAGYFGDRAPARTCVAVAALPAGARVEIALTARRGE